MVWQICAINVSTAATFPRAASYRNFLPAGTRVRVGFRIRIAESLGPQKAEIPNLLGQSVRSAELNLKERGWSLAHRNLPTANAVADQVIAQSPTPDAQQIATPSVNLLISAAPTPKRS